MPDKPRPVAARTVAATNAQPDKRSRTDTGDDLSMLDALDDPGSYQSNHAATGSGGDDERSDADDAKVSGQSRG